MTNPASKRVPENIVPEPAPQRIAFLLGSLVAGGTEQVALDLCRSFLEQGYEVDLLLDKPEGRYIARVPPGARIIKLARAGRLRTRIDVFRADPGGLPVALLPAFLPRKSVKSVRHLTALVRYLESESPDMLISSFHLMNVSAIWAKRLASASTLVVATHHDMISFYRSDPAYANQPRWRYLRPLLARAYRGADALVSVSDGVANELAMFARLPRERIRTIYNPVTKPEITQLAELPVNHPWFMAGEPPVVLAVGRIAREKRHYDLLHAFAAVRKSRMTRLVILGDEEAGGRHAPTRKDLKEEASRLGVADDVDLPGYDDNPFRFMARAAVLVVSSSHEGFCNVIPEALACGCPVVSTDCGGGPREILDDGVYGRLVPVGDISRMAAAIVQTLESQNNSQQLRDRASLYSVDRSAAAYLELLEDIG